MNLKAGYPFSLIKNGLVTNYPKLGKSIRTDIIIMGGGISGALSAYYLIKNGFECTVVDARTIGLGSTCASTSLLQYEIDTSLHKLTGMVGETNAVKAYSLGKEAIDKLFAISDKINFADIQKKRSLYFAAFKKDVVDLKKEFLIRKEHGFHVHYWEKDEVLEKMGIVAPGAILSEDGGQTDAYMLTHALHAYNIKKGLRVFDRTNIARIHHNKKNVELITSDGIKITAKKMIYATGYETVNYIDKQIVQLDSTYATISEPLDHKSTFWKDDMLLWNTADPYLYLRTTPDKRIIVGGRDEKFISPGKRDKLISPKEKKLVTDFNKLFPGINFIPEFSWTGVFGSTKDGLPFIGPYKKLSNSYFALGFGGNGITFSLVAAEIITDLLLGKKNTNASIFSFGRL